MSTRPIRKPSDADISKALAHALRHAPWLYELELDNEGWALIDAVVAGLCSNGPDWQRVSAGDVQHAVRVSEKKRFEIAHERIRALYGHSLPGKLAKEPATPPAVLFHGTCPDVVDRILQHGLLPMGRQYVHLSPDQPTALEVGRRKAARPVLLAVNSLPAFHRGVRFYVGNDRVWLADEVPARYIAITRSI